MSDGYSPESKKTTLNALTTLMQYDVVTRPFNGEALSSLPLKSDISMAVHCDQHHAYIFTLGVVNSPRRKALQIEIVINLSSLHRKPQQLLLPAFLEHRGCCGRIVYLHNLISWDDSLTSRGSTNALFIPGLHCSARVDASDFEVVATILVVNIKAKGAIVSFAEGEAENAAATFADHEGRCCD